MQFLVTGGNGTLGRALAKAAAEQGHRFTAWDRAACPPENETGTIEWIRRCAPDRLIHAAIPATGTGRPNEDHLVNVEWTARLARSAGELGIPFLYVSTVMVFTDRAAGPFTIDSVPDAVDGYGAGKWRGEQAACAANPDARIVRLGWQIGEQPGGNNMLTFLEDKMRDEGRVRASARWYPATSFLADTANALLALSAAPPGLYLIDSNEGWTFYEIAAALSAAHGHRWRIERTEDFVYDQRMRDPRPRMPSLRLRLPSLPRIAS